MIKDKINTISGISLITVIVINVLMYIIDKNPSNVILISMYVSIPLFLIWFGTRKNQCGSCNQVTKSNLESHDTFTKQVRQIKLE